MKRVLLVVLVVAAIAAFVHWPPLNEVETGRTPEYPDLRPREYAEAEDAVTAAARRAGEALGWRVTGSGRGRGGSEVHAVAAPLPGLSEHDVDVRIRREGGRTRVSVRSRSRAALRDFGQNARNVRAFLAELDRQLR